MITFRKYWTIVAPSFPRLEAKSLGAAAFIFLTAASANADVQKGSAAHAPFPELPVVRTPSGVVANRQLPQGIVASADTGIDTLPETPSDAQIFRAHEWGDPLLPTSPSADSEGNAALAQAIRAFHAHPYNMQPYEAFVADHPKSRWTASVQLNLGEIYLQTCYFTKAFASFEAAWNAFSSVSGPKASALAEHAAAQLLRLNARVGRVDALKALFQATSKITFTGSDNETVSGARAGLWKMINKPEAAFLCGPAALEKISLLESPKAGVPELIQTAKSTTKGFSLTGVWQLSEQVGLKLQMVKRAPGAIVVIPAVVHWKVGHFAAIVANDKGALLLEDSTFGLSHTRMVASLAAIDEESSGYMLIPVGPKPAGYSSVSPEEGATIWGKGAPQNDDTSRTTLSDNSTGPCPPLPNSDTAVDTKKNSPPADAGMPVASAVLMVCSLRLSDTPLRYTPPVGPLVSFHLIYNQREASQPALLNYGNLGRQWVSNWLSFVTENVSEIIAPPPTSPAPGQVVSPPIGQAITPVVCVPGGGSEVYSTISTNLPYGPVPASADFGYQSQGHQHLIKLNSSTYEQMNPDGSSYIFGFMSGSNYFLTQAIDANGNVETYSYDGGTRLVAVTDAIGQVTTLGYGDPLNSDHITSVTDPFGRSCSMTYDAEGRMVSVTDVLGLTSTFSYQDSSTFISSMTTPYGTSTFSYSEPKLDRYLYLTDPLGGTEEVHFVDGPESNPAATGPLPANMLVTANNQNDRNTYYWDKKAFMDAPGVESAAHLFHWNHTITGECSGNLENEKMALEGSRTWYNYEGQTTVSFDGATSNVTAVGRVLDDGTTQLVQRTYNSFGRVLSVTDPLGRKTNLQYANGVDVTEVDQITGTGGVHDVIGKATYNGQHEPLTITDASGQTTNLAYNARGQLTTSTDALNEVTTFAYDSNGYLQSITGALPGATLGYGYDGFGRVRSTTDSDGYTLVRDYDVFNRLTAVTFPDGTINQYSYRSLDLEWQQDRLGRKTHFVHDAVRHLVQTEDQLFRSTYFTWCMCGALTGIIDPVGNLTSWGRDVQGRVTSKTFADGTKQTYQYEVNSSRLAASTDAMGQITHLQYFGDDSINQVSFTNATIATPSVTYSYDPFYPRLISRIDGTGTTNYGYNPVPTNPTLGAGRLASVAGPLANSTMSYTYDALGRVSGDAVNGASNAASVSFDALGRPITVTNLLGSFTYGFDGATGRIKSVSYPNGQNSTFSYYPNVGAAAGNEDRRLQQIVNSTPSGSNLSTFGYAYNVTGTIQSWSKTIAVATAATVAFKYDSADQLTDASGPTPASSGNVVTYAYRYDFSGNRMSEQINDAVSAATINSSNQVTSLLPSGPIRFSGIVNNPANITANSIPAVVDASGNFSVDVPLSPGPQTVALVAVDGNGNTTNKSYSITVTNGVTRSLAYDQNGNLINNGSGQTYGWDASNRLVSIAQSSGTTGFIYDGEGHRVGETLNGVLVKQWIWNGASVLEERDSNNNATKRFFSQGEQISGVSYYFSRDQLGSVREITDSSGAIRARYDYDPYGRRTKLSGDLDSDFGFTGDLYHAASGLNLTLFRAYDPVLGRWLSRDPLGEAGGINLYGYVENDPIDWTDRLGLVQDLGNGVTANNGRIISGGSVYNPMEVAAINVMNGVGNPGDNQLLNLASTSIFGPDSVAMIANGALNPDKVSALLGAGAALTIDAASKATSCPVYNDPGPITYPSVGYKGGEITITGPDSSTPDFRINPLGDWDNDNPDAQLPHYHRRPGIGRHRPWDGW